MTITDSPREGILHEPVRFYLRSKWPLYNLLTMTFTFLFHIHTCSNSKESHWYRHAQLMSHTCSNSKESQLMSHTCSNSKESHRYHHGNFMELADIYIHHSIIMFNNTSSRDWNCSWFNNIGGWKTNNSLRYKSNPCKVEQTGRTQEPSDMNICSKFCMCEYGTRRWGVNCWPL